MALILQAVPLQRETSHTDCHLCSAYSTFVSFEHCPFITCDLYVECQRFSEGCVTQKVTNQKLESVILSKQHSQCVFFSVDLGTCPEGPQDFITHGDFHWRGSSVSISGENLFVPRTSATDTFVNLTARQTVTQGDRRQLLKLSRLVPPRRKCQTANGTLKAENWTRTCDL